jgi:hypothetical protein
MNADAVTLLVSDSIARKLFDLIVERKKVRFGELVDPQGPTPESAEKTLTLLKNEELIGEVPGSLRDWNTYFVTAKGLGASRALRRLAKEQ